MSSFFLPSIIASMTAPVLLAVIYLFLYLQRRERFLGLWTLFWASYLLRCFLGILMILQGREPNPIIVDHLPNIVGGMFLLWGTRLFIGQKMPRSWVIGFILSTLWLVFGASVKLPHKVLSFPPFTFFGVVYFWMGIGVLRFGDLRGSGKYMAGFAFILWALLKFSYFIVLPSQAVNPWGYLVGLAIADILAIGLLLAYFEGLHRRLAESEERYRSLVSNIPDIAWTRNRRGTLVYSSTKSGQILKTGNGSETVWFNAIHPGDSQRVKQAWEALFASDKPYDVEYRLRASDGAWLWVHDRALKTYRRKGTVFSDGLLSDISQRKEIERGLQRYERIVSTYYDMMFMLDVDLVCLVANQAFAEACGQKRENLVGKPLTAFLPNSDFIEAFCTRLSRCLEGHPVQWQSRVLLPKTGPRTLNIAAYPYREKQGTIGGIVVNAQDITEIRELEERLHRARRLETISSLAGGVAHQFNNALAAIQGHVDLINLEAHLVSELGPHLEPITNSIRRMAGLTRKLLAYGRGGHYQPFPLDLNEFFSHNLPALTRDIPAGIVVDTHFSKPMPNIIADKVQLKLVCSELITNAVEALETTGKVTIETLNELPMEYRRRHHPEVIDGDYVGLIISDNGRGMDPETTERIFEPFFSTRFTGRGLGMAAVHGIVRSHGGDIAVDSQPGRGTIIRICFPVRQKELADSPCHPAPFSKAQRTLLLVEDEPELVTVGCEILQALNYDVLTATTGAEAIRVFSRHCNEIDLVLLDMKLPDMDGRQIFNRMGEVNRDVKVIICSGYAFNETIEKMLARGAAGFLQKPFSAAHLSEKLQEVL